MRSRYSSNVAFLDMTLNSLLGISALFIIAFLLIRQEDKRTDMPDKPVELMAVLSWPAEGNASFADVDLWISYGPNDDDAVGFRVPAREGIALEIDDLGARSDRFLAKGKSKIETIPINREVINFRRIPEDEIVVNAMYYFHNDKDTPVPCTVQVYALNPFKVIYEGVHTLTYRGEEHTFVRFNMNQDKNITDLHHRPKSIVYAKAQPVLNNWSGGDVQDSGASALEQQSYQYTSPSGSLYQYGGPEGRGP